VLTDDADEGDFVECESDEGCVSTYKVDEADEEMGADEDFVTEAWVEEEEESTEDTATATETATDDTTNAYVLPVILSFVVLMITLSEII
jgi:hypothetical protein